METLEDQAGQLTISNRVASQTKDRSGTVEKKKCKPKRRKLAFPNSGVEPDETFWPWFFGRTAEAKELSAREPDDSSVSQEMLQSNEGEAPDPYDSESDR